MSRQTFLFPQPSPTRSPVRLRQVLINLLNNAIKSTEMGGVELGIEIVPPSETDKTGPDPQLTLVSFSVLDTGLGIARDKQDLIFESFSQADLSTSRKFGGSGLGLAICRQLVSMMGGKIWVESRPGHGSLFRFTVRLPLGDPDKLRPVDMEKAGKAPPEKTLKILLAEDNQVNIKLASALLKKLGHELIVAANGREALVVLTAGRFDVVLMDVEMPEMDGLEGTLRIRHGEAGDQAKHIPIIAMTAHALSGFKEKCLEAGMNDYAISIAPYSPFPQSNLTPLKRPPVKAEPHVFSL